jgi:hypothetical protein
MKISNFNEYIKALIEVEAEGYFVERLINLCKINNIKIWDIVYVNTGKMSNTFLGFKGVLNICNRNLIFYIKEIEHILSKTKIYMEIWRRI